MTILDLSHSAQDERLWKWKIAVEQGRIAPWGCSSSLACAGILLQVLCSHLPSACIHDRVRCWGTGRCWGGTRTIYPFPSLPSLCHREVPRHEDTDTGVCSFSWFRWSWAKCWHCCQWESWVCPLLGCFLQAASLSWHKQSWREPAQLTALGAQWSWRKLEVPSEWDDPH